jgi:hypothetical protein
MPIRKLLAAGVLNRAVGQISNEAQCCEGHTSLKRVLAIRQVKI